MAKNESLPAHLQENDSRGDDRLNLVWTPWKTHRLLIKA